MTTQKIIRTSLAGVLAMGGLLLAGALPAPASAQDVDSRWLPWLGCWEAADGGQEAPLLCVRPLAGGQGVELAAWSEGELISSEAIYTDGVPREVDREGCVGVERARFSQDGQRVYMESEYVCEGGSVRAATGLLAMVNPMEWVDIKVVEASGHRVPWALRYRMARAPREAEVGMEGVVDSRSFAVRSARVAASAPLAEEQFLEVVGEAGAEALEALLVERGDAYDVDASMLVRLADAGVPGKVIDVVVALSYPDRFVLDAGAVEEMGRERGYGDRPMPYAGTYRRWSMWNPFFYDPFYYGYGGYGYGGYGYSPYSFGYYGGYYRPTTVIVQPRPPAETGPVNQMIRGRGYTRGGSSQGTSSTGSVGSTSSGGSSAAASGGSGGSSGSTTRVAKPRGSGGGG
jgi:hypothetical protein